MPPTTIKPSARCCGNCRYWDDGTNEGIPSCELVATMDNAPIDANHSAYEQSIPNSAAIAAYMTEEYAIPMALGSGNEVNLATPAHFHCRLWAEAQPEPSDDANAD